MFLPLTLLFSSLLIVAAAGGGSTEAKAPRLRLTVLFDNILHNEGLQAGWGFSCLVQGLDRTILFDTGGDGDILLANMKALGLAPEIVDVVVLSHIHRDHTGGLQRFLEVNPHVEVWMPASFPEDFRKDVKATGVEIRTVNGPDQLFDKVYTTGEMGERIIEQSLILESSQGLILLTGCAHPGIVDIVRAAKQQRQREVQFVTGGYHLRDHSSKELMAAITGIKEAGVRSVAPSHCTGEKAINLFRELWGNEFVEGGAGAVIEFPL